MHCHRSLRLAVGAAAVVAGCSDDATAPSPRRLSVSPSVRVFTVRDDSVLTSADSALVTVAGAGADTLRWVATHTGAPWVSLVTTSGRGSGVLRWTRDASEYFAGTYVDTITVRLLEPESTTVRLVDSLVMVQSPPRYITVRRAWRPGERDSLAVAIVGGRQWVFPLVGDISSLAPVALAAWDSAVDVIENPEWRPVFSVSGRSALSYDATFTAVGLDLMIVFDSTPGGTIQRDSLPWRMMLWYKVGEPTWHGYVVRSTPLLSWTSQRTVKTSDFDLNYGHPDYTAAGEYHRATNTYWEGTGGGYLLDSNYVVGDSFVVADGRFNGAVGWSGRMGGAVSRLALERAADGGTENPATQKFSATWRANSLRIRCYYYPVPHPTGYSQCVGQGYARIIAAARALRAAGPQVRARQSGLR